MSGPARRTRFGPLQLWRLPVIPKRQPDPFPRLAQPKLQLRRPTARDHAEARLRRLGQSLVADEPTLTTHDDGGFSLVWPARLTIRYAGRQYVVAVVEGVERRLRLHRSNAELASTIKGDGL